MLSIAEGKEIWNKIASDLGNVDNAISIKKRELFELEQQKLRLEGQQSLMLILAENFNKKVQDEQKAIEDAKKKVEQEELEQKRHINEISGFEVYPIE